MKNRIILIYLILFTIILILLRFIGIADFNNNELLGYILIIYGLGLYYSSYLKSIRLGLFFGSVMFLTGIVFLIIGNFIIMDTNQLIVPSIILISAASVFMLYVNDSKQKIALYLSIVFSIAGVVYIGIHSKYGYHDFIPYLLKIIKLYWIVIVMLVTVMLLVNRELKK